MRAVTAYATAGPKAPFEKTTIQRRDLGPSDVLIKIAYAGICHSDIHTAREEWGEAIFPLVPGHEIAGEVDQDFVLGIPEGISLDEAAPLLCAGITLYSPLKHWGAGPGKRVAIVGLGGLGHMGVKIAHALGADVTVLSQTLSKEEDGKRFGADHYYATSDEKTFEELANTFDLIVNTVAANLDVDAYL